MRTDSKTEQFDKMTKTPIPKLIIGLGVPTIVSMLITNVYNLVDTYFVGQIGTSASGAIGVVFGLMAILQAFGFMYGHGAGSIISRKLGQKDYESASRYASTSFILSMITGIIIAVLGIIFIKPLMRLLGSTDTILPFAVQYGFFILIAAPFMTSSCVLNNILRYEGRASFAMVGLSLGGVLNMIGDPIFIKVFDMGIVGAGISTALSQIISFCILFYMFLRGKTQSKIKCKLFTRNINDIADIVVTGFPSMIRQGLGSVSTMLLNSQAAICGGDAAVAAMSIVNRVSMLIFAVGLGIGQGYQPVAAFNFGAGKYRRVRQGYIFTTLLGEVILGAFAILGFIFADSVIAILRDDAEVIEIGILALNCQCVACFFQPATVLSNMMFQSVGESVKAMLLSAMRSGICFIPLILILPRIMGITGVQISQPLADIITFAISMPMTFRFLKILNRDDD